LPDLVAFGPQLGRLQDDLELGRRQLDEVRIEPGVHLFQPGGVLFRERRPELRRRRRPVGEAGEHRQLVEVQPEHIG
jgi:hypothetical protein